MTPVVENVTFVPRRDSRDGAGGRWGLWSMTTFGRIELDSDRGEQRLDTTQHTCRRAHGSGNLSADGVQQR